MKAYILKKQDYNEFEVNRYLEEEKNLYRTGELEFEKDYNIYLDNECDYDPSRSVSFDDICKDDSYGNEKNTSSIENEINTSKI